MSWIKARVADRTSWEGMTLVVVAGLVIVGLPIVKLLAWPALAWGLYTLYKKER